MACAADDHELGASGEDVPRLTAAVQQAAAGQHHSAVLTSEGALYLMGDSALNTLHGKPQPSAWAPRPLPCTGRVRPPPALLMAAHSNATGEDCGVWGLAYTGGD